MLGDLLGLLEEFMEGGEEGGPGCKLLLLSFRVGRYPHINLFQQTGDMTTELFLLGFVHHLVIEHILEDVYTVLDNSHTGMRVGKNPPHFFYYPAVQQHRMVLRVL